MKKLIEAYTVEEVAEALKLHPYTIRRLSREEKIPAFKFGGQWRYRKDEIEKWSRNDTRSK
ncbi:MAG: helix-turn-helix domain-containing protein [Candidatus Omnitrophica bacterium]|nr:helix-turn-helix domain-containing protein [Candidatus Omnitrophota bacterium]